MGVARKTQALSSNSTPSGEAGVYDASMARIRLLLDSVDDVLWFKELTPPKYTLVSQAFERIWGRSAAQLRENPSLWEAGIHPDDRPQVAQALRRWFQDESASYRVIYRVLPPSGETRWVEDHGVILSRKDGLPFQIGGVAREITQQMHADQARSRLASVVESSEDAIITLDLAGVIQTWNAGAEQIFGYTTSEAVGRHVSFLRPPEAADDETVFRNRIRRGIRIHHYETRRRRKDGRVIDISLSLSPLYDENGKLVGFSKISRDVSDRLEAELLRSSEHERQRIGQDLHDDLGQEIAGAWMMSSVLMRALPEGSTARESAARITSHLQNSMNKTRQLARGLLPVAPEQGGIIGALRGLAEHAQELFQLECRFQHRGTPPLDGREACLHLYRIAQEAINNAARHGKARHIWVKLGSRNGGVRLVISDDGTGFDPSVTTGGIGLRIMHQRARAIGGKLEIRPAGTRGTRVICDLPLQDIPRS